MRQRKLSLTTVAFSFRTACLHWSHVRNFSWRQSSHISRGTRYTSLAKTLLPQPSHKVVIERQQPSHNIISATFVAEATWAPQLSHEYTIILLLQPWPSGSIPSTASGESRQSLRAPKAPCGRANIGDRFRDASRASALPEARPA